jgi:hypothetical protein
MANSEVWDIGLWASFGAEQSWIMGCKGPGNFCMLPVVVVAAAGAGVCLSSTRFLWLCGLHFEAFFWHLERL